MDKQLELMIDILRQRKSQTEQAKKMQKCLWNEKPPELQPLLLSCNENLIKNMKKYNLKEIHFNKKKMLYSELKKAINAAYMSVPSVRSNMGCGIFVTLFGLEQTLFEDKMPWILDHLPKEKIKSMEPYNIKLSKEFHEALEQMQYMSNMLKGTGCMVYPLDLQGPFDVAHMVYGDNIFYDMFDDPEFVHHLMELSTNAIIYGVEQQLKILPDYDGLMAHYNELVMPRKLGGLKISEDTSTLVSKEHIEEFIMPYTNKLLKHFGGGYIHYCGKNDHLFEAVMNEPLAYGLNFGNPDDMHDMEYVIKRCAKSNIIYYGFINKQAGETYEQYFLRLLKASYHDGKCHLLLSFSCSSENKNTIIDTWNKCYQKIIRQ